MLCGRRRWQSPDTCLRETKELHDTQVFVSKGLRGGRPVRLFMIVTIRRPKASAERGHSWKGRGPRSKRSLGRSICRRDRNGEVRRMVDVIH